MVFHVNDVVSFGFLGIVLEQKTPARQMKLRRILYERVRRGYVIYGVLAELVPLHRKE